MRPGESPVEARRFIGVACHDFHTEACERPGLLGRRLAGNRARDEWTLAISENRADKPSTLRARGSHDCDDLLLRHVTLLEDGISRVTRRLRRSNEPDFVD